MKYEIKAQGERAELQIYGNIGEDWDAAESNDAKTVVGQIKDLSGDLDVRINSFGGSVSDGLAIFNALRRHKGQVTTYIDGVAYSIASMIAMAGSRVEMASNALMMIHAPWGKAIGNAADLRGMADTLDKHAEAMAAGYLRSGGPSREMINGWLTDGEDHYFGAVDAIELGLVDAVTDPAELTDIAASLKETEFQLPAAERRATVEVAAMADKPTVGDNPTPESNEDIVAKHSKTVQAAQAAGARAEKKRRDVIESVFAGFYDGDPMNPVSAIYDECMGDIKCSELDARRKLQAYLANKTSDPILSAQSYDMPEPSFAPPQASKHLGGVTMGRGSDEKVYAAMGEAIEHKLGMKPDLDRNNPYAGFSFAEMARQFAKACGAAGVDQARPEDVIKAVLRPGMRLNVGPMDIRAQHATGDFPGILANVIDKAIRVMYEQANETWRAVSRVGSVNDFRQGLRPAMTAFDDLLVVPEGGEYKHGEQGDVFEPIQAQKWGRIFSITREALLADDMSAFTDQAMRLAMSASRVVGDQVWAVYTGNPTLSQDGVPLFDALHNNIGTAGAPSVTTLSEMRKLMRVQTDPSGKSTLGVAPALLIVPPIWETEALTLVTAQNLDYTVNTGSEITQQQAANQFGTLTPVVEHRLGGVTGNDTKWFMQASPTGPFPLLEVAFVRGQETPAIESREGFNVDGLEYKVRQEFAVAPLAYQPAVQNDGA